MIIEQYGVKLKRVTEDDIELIRKWRNHKDIKKYFAFQKHITKKMQKKWFLSVNNKLNYFFIIIYKEEKIGIINCKNIDLKNKIGEGGIFIWNSKYLETEVPVFATICFLDFIFNFLNISNKSFIRILKNNKRAISYNKQIGYILLPGQGHNKLQYYVLTKEDYEKKAVRLRKAAQIISGDNDPPRFSGKKEDINLDEINSFLNE
jgi:UDP-4-amino-4,6-dideoxy-N-acetyl-beta-L-altrosamine N-acetyltransferase